MPTVDVSPAVTGDDGRREGGGFFSAAANPQVGFQNAADRFAWFRFPAVTVPQGATIDVAYITLTKFNNPDTIGTAVESQIFGIDVDNETAPTSNAEWLVDHANHTTAVTTFDFAVATSGTVQTPSIVAIIQELVDRAGWSSGNAIGIHIDNDGTSGVNAQGFGDVTDGGRAVLHIEYTVAPDAPTNPAAAALGQTSIRVTWDNVANETGYRVERSPDGVGSWVDVSGNLAADTVQYDDTGLTASTQYFYRVFAFNGAGDSSPSSTVNATTDAAPPTPGGGNRMGGDRAIRKPPR